MKTKPSNKRQVTSQDSKFGMKCQQQNSQQLLNLMISYLSYSFLKTTFALNSKEVDQATVQFTNIMDEEAKCMVDELELNCQKTSQRTS